MRWNCAIRLATPLGFALALAACGQGQAPAVPAAEASAEAAGPAAAQLPVMGAAVPMVALGDSLFAGYGLEPGQSYPAHLEAALRARGINAQIVNAGVSGDTSADGLARLDCTLNSQKQPPKLVLISLGGNDVLRGLPPEQTRANLDAILKKLDERKVPVLLMGMLAPPNLGGDYRARFDPIFPALAKRHGAALVPFFLQPVVGKPELLQADHIHPTLQGVDLIVAATVGQVAQLLPKAAPPPPR